MRFPIGSKRESYVPPCTYEILPREASEPQTFWHFLHFFGQRESREPATEPSTTPHAPSDNVM